MHPFLLYVPQRSLYYCPSLITSKSCTVFSFLRAGIPKGWHFLYHGNLPAVTVKYLHFSFLFEITFEANSPL
jgi:hypothetical protein